jgi:hypothetical protein
VAATLALYPMPIVPPGNVVVVMVNTAERMVIVRLAVFVRGVGLVESVTVIAAVTLVAAVGIPVI